MVVPVGFPHATVARSPSTTTSDLLAMLLANPWQWVVRKLEDSTRYSDPRSRVEGGKRSWAGKVENGLDPARTDNSIT